MVYSLVASRVNCDKIHRVRIANRIIAVTFLQDDSTVTAIVKFYNLTGQYSTDWGQMLAAAVTIVLPVVLAFVFLQRRFIDGMTAGAVKS